jgi:phage-related holin
MTFYDKAHEAISYIFSQASLKSLLSAILAFLSFSLGYDSIIVEVLAYLIIIDWGLGLAASIKYKRFSSFHLSRTLYKILVYLLLLIAAHEAIKVSFIPAFLDDFIEAFITITEFKSILENSALLGFKNARVIEDKINAYLEDKLNKV